MRAGMLGGRGGGMLRPPRGAGMAMAAAAAVADGVGRTGKRRG